MSILSHLEALQYTPNSEDSSVAMAWLDSHDRTFGHFINGVFTEPSDNSIAVVSHANGEPLATISRGTETDIDTAVQSARTAHDIWSTLPPHERALKLYALARMMQRHSRLLAVLECLDNGKPIRETRDIDIPLAVRHFYHHAGWGQIVDTEFPNHQSVGVVGQIIPWNFPFLMLAWKIAPALAMGNTVVLKPADATPLTALLLAEFSMAVGIPQGVINIVTGDGTTGEALARHPHINKIAFTGSTAVGKHLRDITAGSGKSLTLELGGKSPFMVFEDCDLDATVEGVVDAIWFNQGQVCCAGSRVLVQESISDVFYDKLYRRMQNLRVGYCLDKTIDMGSIINPQQLNRIDNMVQDAVNAGAILMQAPRDGWQHDLPEQGCYYPPTVLRDIPTSCPAATEEIFGPVAVGMTFRTVDEAITLANHSRYGLSASIWSESITLCLDVAAQVDAGVVWVNSTNLLDASVGFGGRKESGHGREGGREGCFPYLKPKWLDGLPNRNIVTTTVPDNPNPIIGKNMTVDRTAKLFIGGKQCRPDGGYSHPIHGADGSVLAHVPTGNRKDIRNAVESAHGASGWAKATAHNRAQVLYYLGENLSARVDEFAHRIQSMTGETASSAKKQVNTTISRLFTYGAWADKFEGSVHNPPLKGLALSVPECYGVAGIICPPEMPLLALISTVAPLIAMGNRVIVIPSEPHPLCATDFYSILETSDVPAGVVNIVTGSPKELGKTLAEHHNVNALWAFGSADLSEMVERLSAVNLKRTFVDYGKQFDWLSPDCQGETFLQNTCELKNIWVPYGA